MRDINFITGTILNLHMLLTILLIIYRYTTACIEVMKEYEKKLNTNIEERCNSKAITTDIMVKAFKRMVIDEPILSFMLVTSIGLYVCIIMK